MKTTSNQKSPLTMKLTKKRPVFFLIIILACFFACSDDDNPGFSQDELSPVVTFTHNGQRVEISNINSGLWTSGKALNEEGEEVDGKTAKGFGSVIDAISNGRNQVTVLISRWVSDDEIDYIMPNLSLAIIKPETFKNIFTRGPRLYARNSNPVNTTNEVAIEFTDQDGTYWSSSYQGNYYSTPSYAALQPSSSFTITRSMPLGNDSVFVEAKFKVRLYKNVTEYVEINDGYFRGSYYRKP